MRQPSLERASGAVDGEVAASSRWRSGPGGGARRRSTTQPSGGSASGGSTSKRGAAAALRRPPLGARRRAATSLVVNWQAPAARPFYTATPGEPQRVTAAAAVQDEGARIVGLSRRGARRHCARGAAPLDFLLEELDRGREGRMRDIVATIQGDQYRLITATRTARSSSRAARHRQDGGRAPPRLVAPLLVPRAVRRRGVLVVGPNPTFMEYVSHVLPALGEEAVEQRAVDGARRRHRGRRGAEAARRGAAEGGPAVADVVRRAVERRSAGAAGAPALGRPRLRHASASGRRAGCSTAARVRAAARRRARALPDRRGPSLLRRLRRPLGLRIPHRRRDRAALRPKRPPRRYLDARAAAEAGLVVRACSRPRPRSRRPPTASSTPSEQAAAARGGRHEGLEQHDLPLLDEARELVARAAPGVRVRDRGRGAGPDPAAAAHGRPAERERRVDDARRHRPGDRGCRLTTMVGGRRAPPPARVRRGAAPRLSRPGQIMDSRYRCSPRSRRTSSRPSPTARAARGRARRSPAASARGRARAGGAFRAEGPLAVIAPPSLAAAAPRGTFDEGEVAVLTPGTRRGSSSTTSSSSSRPPIVAEAACASSTSR